jgi:hypothetical protein
MIIRYLKNFARFRDEKITETWNGSYSKMENGQSEVILHPQDGVTIINGLGGAG